MFSKLSALVVTSVFGDVQQEIKKTSKLVIILLALTFSVAVISLLVILFGTVKDSDSHILNKDNLMCQREVIKINNRDYIPLQRI
jgi:hypothetical protein